MGKKTRLNFKQYRASEPLARGPRSARSFAALNWRASRGAGGDGYNLMRGSLISLERKEKWVRPGHAGNQTARIDPSHPRGLTCPIAVTGDLGRRREALILTPKRYGSSMPDIGNLAAPRFP